MALMTEERRKEMEEEMSRFELEIAVPGENKPTPPAIVLNDKPLSPPPAPPLVTALIPEVLSKAPPPPPPPPLSPPVHAVLCPPPPPPVLPAPPPPSPGTIRFIPPQLHRHPPRPPVRPNFVTIRGLPMGGPPGSFPPGPMGPFGPPLAQGPPVNASPIAGPPMPPAGAMHPMPPGPMPLPPGPMPVPHQMGNIGASLPMPPGFCPPMGPPPNLRCDSQNFMSTSVTQNYDSIATTTESQSTSEDSTVVASAPAVYAAPFMKTHSDNAMEMHSSTNGQDHSVSVVTAPAVQKTDKQSTVKIADEPTVGPTAPPTSINEETVVSKKKEKKKKIVRMAGGQAWEDNSLLEWDSDDFRIFCGDLGNDVTDEVLIRAFSKYQSFVKAKVIRDKRTNKTKGYGFVSFKDPQDFIKAMREMNGRYVGSRPIKLRKSTWRDRNIDIVKKKQREKEKLGLL
ncbi:RNA-binding protein 42-like isoform X1 [Stegodyphus dumicola]|uniref:RNA-binding protein 42-like isoform X1 n=1 Tax=Stegodyphus dumicola TaxID=202533 RepID=UPI0015B13130|nr:RNA-binding protein 42-like isoform X1 [Stegodyphus dumicola]